MITGRTEEIAACWTFTHVSSLIDSISQPDAEDLREKWRPRGVRRHGEGTVRTCRRVAARPDSRRGRPAGGTRTGYSAAPGGRGGEPLRVHGSTPRNACELIRCTESRCEATATAAVKSSP